MLIHIYSKFGCKLQSMYSIQPINIIVYACDCWGWLWFVHRWIITITIWWFDLYKFETGNYFAIQEFIAAVE